jgi:hypothetical protein
VKSFLSPEEYEGWLRELEARVETLDAASDREERRRLMAQVTRLRTEQLIEHLGQDLQLAPAPDASRISQFLQATNAINEPPPPTCTDWDGDGAPDTWESPATWTRRHGCLLSLGGHASGATAGLLLLLLAAILRHRRAGSRARRSCDSPPA